MDVCSIHHNKTFLRYSVSLLGYGFYGDVLTDSERKRWMGPARYDISGQHDLHNNRLKESVEKKRKLLLSPSFFQLLSFSMGTLLVCGRC